jgi:hypothetical protein
MPSATNAIRHALALAVAVGAATTQAVACGGSGSSGEGSAEMDDSGASQGVSSGGSSGGSSSGSSGGGSSGSSGAGANLEAGASIHDGSTSGSSSGGGYADASSPDAAGLDPGLAPGGNFDLSVWELQEPVGSADAPTTILPAQLAGPKGFHDTYFFTDPTDGSMSFWDPENGVTTANSNYPRSELREMTASGAAANWASPGTHTLSATLKVTQVPDHVAVGQIHLGTGTPSSTKPLLELYFYATGDIELGIEQTPAGGNEVNHPVGHASLGATWSYVIGLSGNTISLVIDGGAAQTFPMSSTFDQENMYFKAGDYDQSVGGSATVGAKVQFYSLEVFHGP